MFYHNEFFFLGFFFLQFGVPIEQFDICTKLSLEFMVGLTTPPPPPPPPPPGAKGLVKLNHLYGIFVCLV